MELSPFASDIKTLLKDNTKIELINFEQLDDCFILHITLDSYPIKITTNFENYCYFESEVISTEDLNNYFFENKINDPKFIISKLNEYKMTNNNNINNKIELTDHFHIYQLIEDVSKVLINYELVEKESKLQRDTQTNIDISKFPKALLFNTNQIYQIIISEIKSFNHNMSFKHFIEPINNNPYNLKLILFLNSSKLENFELEMKITIDPKLYPFYPPKFEFIRPSIKLPLVYSLMNLKLLKIENWNPTISLEWIIEKLVEQIQPILHDYLHVQDNNKFSELDNILVKLTSLTKEYSSELELINITIPKMSSDKTNTSNNNSNTYWKSGVGYGHDAREAWDITAYIKEQEVQNNELCNLIKKINEYITEDSLDILLSSTFNTFLINRIKGLTLLELDKYQYLYNEILSSINKLTLLKNFKLNMKFINEINQAFNSISEEIQSLFESSKETQENDLYLQIHCSSDWFKSNAVIQTELNNEIIVKSNIKDEYETIMKKLQFGTYEIPDYHRCKDYLKQKPESKAIMRMISEISTFKTGLPLNWESTAWVRVSKSNMNVFSFFISGPKDTPYENGIFEFNSAFPSNYPNKEPYVLLHTTGGGSIRFNPNLYNCGKVCLSLLGTWSGQEGEKWNPKTSTFLQVIVSIQSLIFVETPYFNEPGWEKSMNTPEGQKKSKEYNEPLQVGTIEWAINQMLTSPPAGMEEVINIHFKMKKEEIINTTKKWLDEISPNYKNKLEKVRNDMLVLFDKL